MPWSKPNRKLTRDIVQIGLVKLSSHCTCIHEIMFMVQIFWNTEYVSLNLG